jgi:multidrug efflux pump subunit AcrA (membrane-fusion protein)
MRKKRAAALVKWVVVIAVVVVVGAVGAKFALDYARPKVMVTNVVEGPVVQAFYATGTLSPEREYPIKSNNAGVLTKVLVDKGAKVSLNQELAVVLEDSVEFKYKQALAERDQKTALADESTSPALAEIDARLAVLVDLIQIARREQTRVTTMLEKNAASQADLDRAMDRVKVLQGEQEMLKASRKTKKLEQEKDLRLATAAVEIAQWNLDRQTVRCPIDHATVLDRPTSVGTRVAVNDHLMLVADVRPDHLVMRAAVDEEDITKVKAGGMVRMTLYAFEGRQFTGKVKTVYDKADPNRRTFEVDVEMVDKDPAFAPGMTGELAFVLHEKPSTRLVPSQAVQSGAIWIVKDGKLVKADAKIGLRSIERTEILSGLSNGDQIVLTPIGDLPEGKAVRTTFTDPLAAALLNKPKKDEVFKGGF